MTRPPIYRTIQRCWPRQHHSNAPLAVFSMTRNGGEHALYVALDAVSPVGVGRRRRDLATPPDQNHYGPVYVYSAPRRRPPQLDAYHEGRASSLIATRRRLCTYWYMTLRIVATPAALWRAGTFPHASSPHAHTRGCRGTAWVCYVSFEPGGLPHLALPAYTIAAPCRLQLRVTCRL